MKRIIVILVLLSAFTVNAQELKDPTRKHIADSVKKDFFTAPDTIKRLHSKAWALIPPALLISYGILSFDVHPIRRLDYSIYNSIIAQHPNFNNNIDNYLLYSPVAIVYGLNLAGISGKDRFVDRTMLLVISEGFVNVASFSVKHITHRLRPDGSDYYSFPSEHTGNAFAIAEFMAQEYGDQSPLYSILGYSFAIATGTLRIYNRDHWFSDVVTGAGFGILATKGAYLIYPYVRNRLFKAGRQKVGNENVPGLKKRSEESIILIPSYQNGAVGFQLAMEL